MGTVGESPGGKTMFWLHISGAGGVEAEFHVDSAAMALDLALRSGRAGLNWRAESRAAQPAIPVTLSGLRKHAAAAAETCEIERRMLDEVEWQHELQTGFSLN
jgi:hypothetical protein